ncbi:MAG TPA: energy transducer TonB, partial [Flavobacterium sp.]
SKGRMIFSFTISTTGEVTNIRIVQFVDMEAAKEIIRVLKQAPKWECARRAGKPFAVDVKFPLDFE